MQGEFILAIDQGTTGSRALLIDRGGNIISSEYSEFRQFFPKPGWVEHDAEEIFKVTLKVIQKVLRSAGISGKKIVAIGITNQRETTVLWERKTAKPVHRAIVWQCRRTSDICEDLKRRGLSGLFLRKTGLVIDPYFSATKVKWILDNFAQIRSRAKKGEIAFGTIDSWLIYKLTGKKVHATDYTNASRTLLFNIHKREFDDELLEILDIPKAILPEPKDSSGIFGWTDIPILPRGIPISGVAGDQQASLFGQACFDAGLAKNTYGTGCFMLVFLGDKKVISKNGLLTTLACDKNGKPAYALEGSIFITGAAIQWLRDGLRIIKEASETEKLAKSVKDSEGVYFVPAFVGLGAPYWDMSARGAILGLTRGVRREHIVRATLESIAYQTRDLVLAMEKDLSGLKIKVKELRVDGGATRNNFLMQFQADILGIPVDRSAMAETTALGAGYLAGLGVGFWESGEAIKKLRKRDAVFSPRMKSSERERLYRGWLEAVERVRSC